MSNAKPVAKEDLLFHELYSADAKEGRGRRRNLMAAVALTCVATLAAAAAAVSLVASPLHGIVAGNSPQVNYVLTYRFS